MCGSYENLELSYTFCGLMCDSCKNLELPHTFGDLMCDRCENPELPHATNISHITINKNSALKSFNDFKADRIFN